MALRVVTKEIIQLVESQTGIPVQVVEDPALPELATVQLARSGDLPAHVITYRQGPGEIPDYQICFDCCFILRLFANPPSKRLDLTYTEKAYQEVKKLITAPEGVVFMYQLNRDQIEEFVSRFLNLLMVFLHSVPIGLRVSEWLSVKYPELEELEKDHVQRGLDIDRQMMQDEVRDITPPKVFSVAQSISAAYAWYWSEIYRKPEWFDLYRFYGFEKDGQKLADLVELGPDDPLHDQALVDSWGKYLGITDWYTWVRYRPPAEV